MFGDLTQYTFRPFSECTKFIDYRGKTPQLSDDGTIRMINAKSVGKGFFKHVDEFITEETYNEWMKRGFPIEGDVLFVTEGHTFGNVCTIPANIGKFAMGQRVITIQGNKELLNNTYLATYMQTDVFKKEIEKYKTGSSAQGIRSKELIKIEVPIPQVSLQNQFAEFVQQVDKLKFEVEKNKNALKNFYCSKDKNYYK